MFSRAGFAVLTLAIINLHVTSAGAEELHERWLRFMEGEWEFKMDDNRTGRVTLRSVGSVHALNFSANAEEFAITGVIGWRPAGKKFVETDYVVNREDRNSLDREFSVITKDSLTGKQVVSLADGSTVTDKLEYRRLGENTMSLSGVREDGTKWWVNFNRVRKK